MVNFSTQIDAGELPKSPWVPQAKKLLVFFPTKMNTGELPKSSWAARAKKLLISVLKLKLGSCPKAPGLASPRIELRPSNLDLATGSSEIVNFE